MPEDFYEIGPSANRKFDDIGLRAFDRNWAAWPGEPSDDLMSRSQFNFFHDIGVHLFGRNSRQVLDYSMYFMERRKIVALIVRAADAQRCLPFGWSTKETSATVPA
jgi:hypothetical protein